MNTQDYQNSQVEQQYSQLLFSNREQGHQHNPYSDELRMLSCIENGDVELLKSTFSTEHIHEYGTLAKNQTRNYKNISISAITLISRAAIRGGVNPELAFSLCDSYILQIEEVKHLPNLKPLLESAKLRFATMVHEIRSNRPKEISTPFHPLLERSKDYILSHLHSRITLQETAYQLNANANYISELFRKYEGLSFSHYVMNEKIKQAKSLLLYSTYSYSEIAAYLGFASQSHLGKHFKAITQMTMKQFRDYYSATEFRSS